MKKFRMIMISICICLIYENTYAQQLNNQIWLKNDWKNLLHYSGERSVINSDSDFFLSPDGYKNSQAEYFATLKAMADNDISKGDNHAICRYPARFNYIVRSLNLKANNFPQPQCLAYEEYQQKVPIEKVAIVFASENNISPSSMIGHTFLKLSGTNDRGLKEHSFSYFAALNQIDLKFYVDAVTTGLDGAYVLSPYSEKAAEYLYKEKRSLWEFDLKLTPSEIERLKMHLWELKGSNIRYSLISHNCNTAVISILKTANANLKSKSVKPFVTPMEYVQELQAKERLKHISIEPTDYTKEKINQYGVKNILNANKASRIEIAHHANYDTTILKLSPVYQDIRDVNNAYFDEMESKIGEISFGYSGRSDRAYIQSINILKMRSILDYSIAHDYSKHIQLSLENNLGKTGTDLKPTAEIGLGYGEYGKKIISYILPRIGFRYSHIGNLYLAPEVGIIINVTDNFKMISSYEQYYNSRKNNRGYNSQYYTYIGYKINSVFDIYIAYSRYTEANIDDDFVLGISGKF